MKKNVVIIVLIVIIILLLSAFGFLVSTDVISFNKKSKEEPVILKDNREMIVSKLKEALTDDEWVKENLYVKENCFGQKREKFSSVLKFEVIDDNNNNPIVIVDDYSIDDFISASFKVYFDGEKVVSKMIGAVGHPGHSGFSIDKNQGLVVVVYGHMGNFVQLAYDVKGEEVTEYDEYRCDTGDCEYVYKGDKSYNLTDFSIELNDENVYKYVK
ncbi:MAG: hypothetical protein IJI49_04385 [Bacilli bacterium]|nr:hypothetical protein [Bacilli bacterium]